MQNHKYSINQKENLDFVRELRCLLDSYKDRTMVGEISNLELQAEYTSKKDKLHMAYSFELLRKDFSPDHIRNCLENFFKLSEDGFPCWSFSNHDVVRHSSRWSDQAYSEDAFAKLTSSLLLSLKGSICLFQGEELGQLETDIKFHELTDPPGIKFWPKDKGRDGWLSMNTLDQEDVNTQEANLGARRKRGFLSSSSSSSSSSTPPLRRPARQRQRIHTDEETPTNPPASTGTTQKLKFNRAQLRFSAWFRFWLSFGFT